MYIAVLSFKFDGVDNLPPGRNAFNISPDWSISAPGRGRCWTKSAWAEDRNGNSWRIRLCRDHLPGNGSDEAMISFVLDKEEQEDSSSGATKFAIVLRDANGSVVKESTIESSHISLHCKGFVEQQFVLDNDNNILVGGALHIDLVIQPEQQVSRSCVSSQNTLVINLLKLLESGGMADLSFKFSDCIVVAHRFVLAVNAPGILQFFEDDYSIPIENTSSEIFRHVLRYIYGGGPPEKAFVLEHALDIMDVADYYNVVGLKLEAEATLVASRSITVANVVEYILFAEIFRHVLRYIYGGGPPKKDFLLEHAMDIIDVANYFGVDGLKLEAEATLVASRSITVANFVEYILFADAKECALLKKYAVSVFIARSKDVINSESFMELAKSPKLMKELMLSVVDYGGTPPIEGDDFGMMSVITLRKRLEEKGLDIDGSKEMLISRLESAD
eukprot:CAMPEP_0201903904 /NCGR_PEP_ID=MMETSP0902-20130614/55721_1 /ASSEMBLY_ACC=CAM_ASM_000551 /TAXON_ID=420261 /ORGANISM="Thalassiosira antarctica, Strain CCMP982" /LENGTH=445 /DNA_ID=CAMNT_0048437973 /DNA_START=300 /DNA_END=1637 /DNA_ORIENTATION=+